YVPGYSVIHSYCRFLLTDSATPEIYTLSLHDALPICLRGRATPGGRERAAGRAGKPRVVREHLAVHTSGAAAVRVQPAHQKPARDRKSTRLNSSHQIISYAVFCLKKKIKKPAHNR